MFAAYTNEMGKLGGRRAVYAQIVADATPSALPTSGLEIENLGQDCAFWPLSYIFVTDPAAEHQLYVANEQGIFVAQ